MEPDLTHSGQIRRLKKKQPNPTKGLTALVSSVMGTIKLLSAESISLHRARCAA
jgi:hypothetical protein